MPRSRRCEQLSEAVQEVVLQRHRPNPLTKPVEVIAEHVLELANEPQSPGVAGRAAGSGAPIWNTLFGWWGRGAGWLAWLRAAFLLLGAATLTPREAARTVTWLLEGASIVALIGLLQIGGVNFPEGAGGQVSGTMGNTNFASGYFAIIASLALGRALTQAVLWQRIWGGVLFVLLAFLA